MRHTLYATSTAQTLAALGPGGVFSVQTEGDLAVILTPAFFKFLRSTSLNKVYDHVSTMLLLGPRTQLVPLFEVRERDVCDMTDNALEVSVEQAFGEMYDNGFMEYDDGWAFIPQFYTYVELTPQEFADSLPLWDRRLARAGSCGVYFTLRCRALRDLRGRMADKLTLEELKDAVTRRRVTDDMLSRLHDLKLSDLLRLDSSYRGWPKGALVEVIRKSFGHSAYKNGNAWYEIAAQERRLAILRNQMRTLQQEIDTRLADIERLKNVRD